MKCEPAYIIRNCSLQTSR